MSKRHRQDLATTGARYGVDVEMLLARVRDSVVEHPAEAAAILFGLGFVAGGGLFSRLFFRLVLNVGGAALATELLNTLERASSRLATS